MATYMSRLSFMIKRLTGFLQTFRRSKRGTFGVGILVFFIIIALAAPLLTPYGPRQPKLAGSRAAPVWLRYLPGGERFSENFAPIIDPRFDSQTSLNEWKFEVTPSDCNVLVQHISSVGTPGGTPGCIALTYERKTESSDPIQFKATLSKEFYYPYGGPPEHFSGRISLLLERLKDVSVEVKVFIRQGWMESETHDLFEYKKFEWGLGEWNEPKKSSLVETYNETTLMSNKRFLRWISAKESIGSKPVGIADQVFAKPSSYTYGVEILFEDKMSKDSAEAMIYIDNLNIELYGTAFGLFGTDNVGSDIFTQLVYGSRVSLLIGILASILSVFIGLVVGLVAAYAGGIVDEVLMRVTDAMLVLPTLPLLMVLTVSLGKGMQMMEIFIILIGFLGWMGFARTVRSQVLSLKERPYVEAAKAIGAGGFHILSRHIVPNVVSLIYVTLAMSVPTAITIEASLSWLGFYDPFRVSWGGMLYDVRTQNAYRDWWWVVPPGLCIALVSIAFILLGYALDEVLNPKLRIRR